MARRREYTSEFKEEAVRMVEGHPDLSLTAVAKSLEVPLSVLSRWVKQFGRRPEGTPLTPAEHEELLRLRREVALLRTEREILKKAIGICSQELP
jgi:transposase